MKDYYDIIGVPKNATKKAIEERYKFLTQAFHPEKFDDPAQKKKAEKDFAAIEEAYQVLSDPTRRADYDRSTAIAAEPVAAQPPKTKNRTWLYVLGGFVVVLLMVGAGLLGRFLPLGDKDPAETAGPVSAESTEGSTAATAVPNLVGVAPGECRVTESIFPPEKGDEWKKYTPVGLADYVKGPEDARMTIFEYSDFT
jgi:curved DNA-binding protein CbpA